MVFKKNSFALNFIVEKKTVAAGHKIMSKIAIHWTLFFFSLFDIFDAALVGNVTGRFYNNMASTRTKWRPILTEIVTIFSCHIFFTNSWRFESENTLLKHLWRLPYLTVL